MARRTLLTKHGKYYEINPYKIIQWLEDIRDVVSDYEEGSFSKPATDEIDGLIDKLYIEGNLPR